MSRPASVWPTTWPATSSLSASRDWCRAKSESYSRKPSTGVIEATGTGGA
jgi:hypothetical protein